MLTVRTLYFDESGYTGYNLLDPVQPMFAIASTDISPDEAATILRESFPHYGGSEYKFTNVWRSNNRKGLVEFGRRLAPLGDRAFSWMMDKQFVVLTKIVDFLIEPFVTNAGYDFYADGFCWKYANYIHVGLEQFAPPGLYERLLKAYQRFSREPSMDELRRLQRVLQGLKTEAPEELQVFLDQMELGANLFTEFNHLPSFRDSSEIQVTSMVASVAHWRRTYTEDLEVVHDATANFFRRREIWERMTNADAPRQLLTRGDGTAIEFPLRVVATTPVDSKDNHSVQFCDVLAGLTTKIFDRRIGGADRDFLNDVIHAGMGALSYDGVRPSTTFPAQIPPRRLAGPDNVDKMTEVMFGPRNAHRGKLKT
jgi:hypothetical protein